jgi:hypothetical protein
MRVMTLNPTEDRIIRSIILKNFGSGAAVMRQVSALRFPARHTTGTGYYIEFEPVPEPLKARDNYAAVSLDMRTNLAPPRDLIGFTLFMVEGRISSFEGYTFGDVAWPEEPMAEWLILEDLADQRVD